MNEKKEGVKGYGEGGFGYVPPKIKSPIKSYESSPVIVRLTMKLSGGLIKNEKQANYTLLAISIVFIIVSLFLFFGTGSENNKKLEEKERLLLEEIVSSTM